MRRRYSLLHSRGICKPYVLGRVCDKSPAYYPRIDSGIDHPPKPRQRSVGIRTSQTLAERRQHIVEVLVVYVYYLALYRLLRYTDVDMYTVVFKLCRQYRKLYCVKRTPRIAV